jgi:hypothetical protein
MYEIPFPDRAYRPGRGMETRGAVPATDDDVRIGAGFKAGILSQDLYTVFFAMALLTTGAGGLIANTVLRPLVLAERSKGERTPAAADVVPSPGVG